MNKYLYAWDWMKNMIDWLIDLFIKYGSCGDFHILLVEDYPLRIGSNVDCHLLLVGEDLACTDIEYSHYGHNQRCTAGQLEYLLT